MEYIEVSAKTVDEAITKASIELGMPSSDLDIQVISQGSSGFLGFGSKPAVIKVRSKEDIEAAQKKEEEAEKEARKPKVKNNNNKNNNENINKNIRSEVSEKKNNESLSEKNDEVKPEKKERTDKKERPERKNRPERNQKPKQEKQQDKKEEKPSFEEKKPVPVRTEEEVEGLKAASLEFLKGVFASMKLEVNITAEYDKEEGSLDINFEGEDMGVLIGKRGQTLDSLQYLTSLVVNKGQKDYIRIKLDTEDYRKRRKETLENLARNIASKVKKTRKTVVLEPMNPYERRIIHSALQGNRGVETFSEGNEPYRHIVIKPVKSQQRD